MENESAMEERAEGDLEGGMYPKRLVPPGADIGGGSMPTNPTQFGSGDEVDEPGHEGAKKTGYHDMGSINADSDPASTIPGVKNHSRRLYK